MVPSLDKSKLHFSELTSCFFAKPNCNQRTGLVSNLKWRVAR